MRPVLAFLPALLVASLGITGCGDDDPEETSGSGGSTLTLENCGEQITLETPVDRVVIMDSNAVPLLAAVDALDRIVARGGDFAADLFDEATAQAVDRIPALSETRGSTGGVELSLEVLLDQQPDLVVGYATSTITREGLDDAGVPLLVQPGFCDGPADPDVGFEDVYAEVELYGQIFEAPDEAASAIADLRDRVATAARSATGERSAAFLYLTEDGGSLSGYGNRGIVHDQLESSRMSNVFGDVDKRVFDITIEELLGRDPDVVIILRTIDQDPQVLVEALLGLPGADRLTAVRTDAVSTFIFNYGDPPTPLSVEGLEILSGEFGAR